MVFHTNDSKSTTEIFLKKFTYAWDVPVYECGLIDTGVLEEHTLIIVSIYSSNLKSAMKTVYFFLDAFEKLQNVTARTPTWNNSAPTGWIFMKFGIWRFLQNLTGTLKFY
jgi:hypothetical protein